ncbi:chaplin [Actinacidiphila yeochonensis]|uniref:chaplin n=1 Tax=Actinacidiphila yeochonensis TaxID=89050 RepID=UPI0006923B02|nr:chaplin [Actinacidiphila yeochonensis]
MRQILSRSLLTVAAVGGVLAATGGAAHADSTATGNAAGSPGVLSGNSVQVPVNVPVNACGNTVDAVGVLNPAFGNNCQNTAGAPPAQAAPTTPPPPAPTTTPPVRQAPPAPRHTQLAETGLNVREAGAASAAGAALLLGGALLYRRSSRASARTR